MKRSVISIVASALVLAPLAAAAAPPHPGLLKEVREGLRPEPAYMRTLRETGPPEGRRVKKILPLLRKMGILPGVTGKAPGSPGAETLFGEAPPYSPAPPTTGSPYVLALLVEFSDESGQTAASYFDDLIFGTDGPSVDHFYREVSGGALDIGTADAPSSTGWLTLGGTKAFYNSEYIMRSMVADAVAAVDSQVDFSQYDNDSDGMVDYFILVHSGTGAELTGNDSDIWSHQASISSPVATSDGVSINSYMTVPEYWFSSGDMTIGTYCHEFGHLLGLPDFYDLYWDSEGIGAWGLMGYGSWNGPLGMGESPSYPSAWSRIALSWVIPEAPSDNLFGVTLSPVESSGPVYFLWNDGVANSEYFLIENRQWTGYDSWLPHHGLLIWHVDEIMTTNNSQITSHNDCNWPMHYMMALQQADGYLNLERNMNSGDAGDPYPGVLGKTEFSVRTTPNSGSYANCLSKVGILDIQEIGSDITADLYPDAAPSLMVSGFSDLTPLLPGMTAGLTVTLTNGGMDATGVTGTLSSMDPLVTVTVDSAAYPDIGMGIAETNSSSPFVIALDPSLAPGTIVDFEVAVAADNGYADTLTFPLAVGPATVLFVDDDRDDPADYSTLFMDPLAELERGAGYWDYALRGTPPDFLIDRFPAVLWTTGATFSSTITSDDEDLLSSYLSGGGSLALSSQDYMYDSNITYGGLSSFLTSYLHVSTYTGEQSISQVTGYNGDPVSSGLGPYDLAFPPGFFNRPDHVYADAQASPMFRKPSAPPAAIRYSGSAFRSAFFTFPLEAMSGTDRTEVMANLLPWLSPAEADSSGDGLPDILVSRPDISGGADIMVLESAGGSLRDPSDRGDLDGDEDFLLRGDLDGDGLADLLRGRAVAGDTFEWSAHIARWSYDGMSWKTILEDSGIWHAGLGSPDGRFLIGDADGDGRDDLIFAEPAVENPRIARWMAALSTGQGLGDAQEWSPGFGKLKRGHYLAGDINGDGRADLVWGKPKASNPAIVKWKAAPSTGAAFMPGVLWSADAGCSDSRFLLGDADGDGMDDLVFSMPRSKRRKPFRWKVARSTGTYFAGAERWKSRFGKFRWKGFALADLDGNGGADLVGWKKTIDDRWIFSGALSTGSYFTGIGTIADTPRTTGDAVIP